MSSLSETFKLRMEPELLEDLHERARRERIPAAIIVRRALRLHLRDSAVDLPDNRPRAATKED